MSTEEVILYDMPLSSYAQKIRIALREKGIPFTKRSPASPNLEDAQAFASANPRAEVPVLLVEGGNPIFDSTVILEYIEERWADPPLLPRGNPLARAKARMIEDICDTQYEAINWAWGEATWMDRAEGALRDRLKAQCEHQTGVIQGWLATQLGTQTWFGGDTFGWADVCAVAIVNRSDCFGFGPAQGSALHAWLERARGRESVQKTLEEFREGVAAMPGMKDMFISGKRKREYRDHRLEYLVKCGGIEIVAEGLRRNNIKFSWPEPLELGKSS